MAGQAVLSSPFVLNWDALTMCQAHLFCVRDTLWPHHIHWPHDAAFRHGTLPSSLHPGLTCRTVGFLAFHSPLRAAGKKPISLLMKASQAGVYAVILFISAASVTRQVCMVLPTFTYNLTVIWTVDWIWSGDCASALLYRLFTCILTWSEY